MKQQRTRRLFLGVLTIPVAGALAVVALLFRGPVILPTGNVPEWASTVSTGVYLATQYGMIVAFVLPLLGFWALYEHISQARQVERLAFVGMLASVWGTALALPTLGITAFVTPVAGKLYGSGLTEIIQVVSESVTRSAMGIGLISAVLYTVGPLLLGVAAWRSGLVPRGAAILFALHGALLSFGFSLFPLLILGWVLLTISGIGMSWRMAKR